MEQIPLLAVVGPTASGKTRLAVDLAVRFRGEVISADSMQIYRGMNIGTAKPSPEETKSVPHHMIDIADPREVFSVADYVVAAAQAIRRVHESGKLPILAGGTGLYVSSLMDNIQFNPAGSDEMLRRELRETAVSEGGGVLLEILREFDPESAARLHPNNIGRIIRAIEVYRTTGVTMTEMNRRSREVPSNYRPCMIGLFYSDRSELYGKIERRVDDMMANGLVDEVRELLDQGLGGQTSMQAIGYKEIAEYLRGEISLDQAVEQIKKGTRHYAKRQMTWFRRDSRIHWIDAGLFKYEEIYNEACKLIDKCNML